ncbi:MAG TPA: hypothetical protein VMU56_09995 [Beijerinckiaceae bacterium]|nr:hypothetical protein [Beijerinckiaceae bacterium]
MVTKEGPGPGADEIAGIASFMRAASFEITRPTEKDVKELRETLAPGTDVYLTAVPRRPLEDLVEAAIAVRAAGLEPIPHIAARHFASLTHIEELAGRLVREANVHKIMLVGGDMAPQPGAVPDALSVLQSGILQAAGLTDVGLPGFPDGHPVLSGDELELALVTKTAAAQSAGLAAHIVTQFCFDSRPIVRWLGWLRERGVHVPVRVGFAGPTSLMGWLKFARKCGVRASAEALASRSGLAKHAFKTVAPDLIVRDIAAALREGRIDQVEPHFFAFGGAGLTTRWAAAPAQGRIALNHDGGFDPA